MKFRKRIDAFFSKRSRSWHVACFIKRAREDDDRLEVDTFVHLFDTCVQDWFSVASIIEHIICEIKMEDPSITKFYLRSDNAGCYHNTELLLSLKAMGHRHGVVFKRYDFSEPQSGKDVCDRRIASMKTHIRRFFLFLFFCFVFLFFFSCNDFIELLTMELQTIHSRKTKTKTKTKKHIRDT